MRGACRSLVSFTETPYELKIVTKRFVQFLQIITLDLETAASWRSVVGERRDDQMAIPLQGAIQCPKVRRPFARTCQKVKYSSVVPDFVSVSG